MHRTGLDDAAGLGAAVCAAVGAGVHPDWEAALAAMVHPGDETRPGADAATYRRMFWEGKIAMNIDNGGVAGIFAAQNPNLGFKAAPSPFPNRQ